MGATPDRTTLYAEGCADVAPPTLVEAWARHTLNWITRWEDEGVRPLHAEWRGLGHGIGEPVTSGDLSGTFLGVDEDFGMLLRDDTTTHLIPLTALLDITLRELKHQSYCKRLRPRAPCTGRARRHKATRELRAKQPLNAAAAQP